VLGLSNPLAYQFNQKMAERGPQEEKAMQLNKG